MLSDASGVLVVFSVALTPSNGGARISKTVGTKYIIHSHFKNIACNPNLLIKERKITTQKVNVE